MNYLYWLLVIVVIAAIIIFLLKSSLKREEERRRNTERKLASSESVNRTLSEKLISAEQLLKSKQEQIHLLQEELTRHKNNLSNVLESNLISMPWLAGMIADFITYDLEIEAKKLDWGYNVQRQKKVASIRLIRSEATRRITEAKEAVYQLEYIRTLIPGIDDLLSTDYKEIDYSGSIPDHDPVLDYLTKEEWQQLDEDAKNQLALDRYIASRKKSKWQIGRDYELSVAYEYSKKGYRVETYGSYMGLEDLGRDLIAVKQGQTLIIQCKYWAQHKEIHEKHIYQLYGTTVGYCIENRKSNDDVHALLITNTRLSQKAREIAIYLHVTFVENHSMADFPRIKCNIGHDDYGRTKIYHLPMDSQYDVTKIENTGEFYAFTVKEARDAGFRRAYKWHGNN